MKSNDCRAPIPSCEIYRGQTQLPLWRTTVTRIDPTWLEAFDKELLHLFAIDHSDAGMDEYLLGCYADLPPRDAALAFGSDYDLERDDALWPRPGVPV